MQDADKNVQRRVAGVQRPADQQLVQDHARARQRRRPARPAADLPGRPGPDCSGAMSRGVPTARSVSVATAAASSARRLARPKSAILGAPSAVSSTLAGFRSRWTTPRSVGELHRPASSSHKVGGPARRPRRAVEMGGQGAALDVLQREVGQAIDLADLVNLHDVRVLQPGDGLRPRCGSG